MYAAYYRWRKALKKTILSHGNISELLDTCRELMPYPLLAFRGDKLSACSPCYRDKARAGWETYRSLSLRELRLILCSSGAERGNPVSYETASGSHGQILLGAASPDGTRKRRLLALSDDVPLSAGDMDFMRTLSEAAGQLEDWGKPAERFAVQDSEIHQAQTQRILHSMG